MAGDVVGSSLLGRWKVSDALFADRLFDDAGGGEGGAVVTVLVAAGGGFGDTHLVDLQAPADHPGVRRLADHGDQPVPPSWWQRGGGGLDALGVVAVDLVEPRPFTDRAIDAVGKFGLVDGDIQSAASAR
ncbi:MAG: hypothetical protein MUF83_10660 [Acidimicrobiales bacterium]|nr:hypothetical protein [Acidimicrobiales bacterium]